MNQQLFEYLQWAKVELDKATEKLEQATKLYEQAERVYKKHAGIEEENES